MLLLNFYITKSFFAHIFNHTNNCIKYTPTIQSQMQLTYINNYEMFNKIFFKSLIILKKKNLYTLFGLFIFCRRALGQKICTYNSCNLLFVG